MKPATRPATPVPRYYHIVSKRDEVLDADRAWVRRVGRSVTCTGCSAVSVSHEPRPIDVVVVGRPHATMVGVFRGVPLMKRGLAAWLAEAGVRLVTGLATDATGNEFAQYVTYYVPRRDTVMVHRGRNTTYRRCDACRRLIPTSWHPPEHFVEAEVEGRKLFFDINGWLYLSQEMAMALPIREFPDLTIKEIPVLDTALDEGSYPRI